MATSKIKNIQGKGEKNGWLNFDIDLEDGTSGQKGFKQHPTWLTIGLEVEYEMNEKYPTLFKTLKSVGFRPDNKKDDSYVKGIEVGHAVNNAVNMLCAGLEFDDIDPKLNNDNKIYLYAKHIMKISEKLKSE